MKTHRFHAWRRMRDLGPSWKLAWSCDLPDDMYGYTNFIDRTITLREGLSFEERRCTITHEVEHVLRGPTSRCFVLHEEVRVDRRASRLLLSSVRDIADTLSYHHGDYERAAEDLWVDPWMLEVRLGSLWRNEQRYMDRRMAEVTVGE
ncbi:hypothetical protein LRP67_16450 [Nocardioides sp. cx-169]|uniref:hypothetical protein n=1 Tax=Nocardioides sp. cx-169 TaxID=2899080 RepID=UPI001E55FCE1|nr:hypothetical protein [Nocardioides sp. cx-169]MCD4535685.1 hypothetical protein [Nocardioides sp. cx-169]